LNWIAGIAEYSELIRRLHTVSKEAVLSAGLKISEVLTMAVNAGKKVYQRTAQNFYVLEALGDAYGYEPPGFRGVVESAIANRDRITTYHFPFIPELAQ